MANQSPDRRHFLEMLAKAAAASQFPGFSRWAFAYGEQHEPRPAHYQPLFFTAGEYQTITVLTELIIPRDETPGAAEAGVSEFIDFMAAHGEQELREPMRGGLKALDAKAKGGSHFVTLSPAEQTALLASMQGTDLFRLIRRYTVMGYYTSRVGLEELDFPGLKLSRVRPSARIRTTRSTGTWGRQEFSAKTNLRRRSDRDRSGRRHGHSCALPGGREGLRAQW